MKTTIMLLYLLPGMLGTAEGQNFTADLDSGASSSAREASHLPELTKAEGIPAERNPAYQLQGGNLGFRSFREETPVTSGSSPLRKDEAGGNELELLSATYREVAKASNGKDCGEIALAVKTRSANDPSVLLEALEAEVKASPSCACEIVKSAIQASDGEIRTVVNLVETAIHAAPAQMRLISQCAIATAPESLTAVQALMARLDPNAGEPSSSENAKDAKSGKDIVAAARQNGIPETGQNPLDRGLHFWAAPPPILVPPEVTRINP